MSRRLPEFCPSGFFYWAGGVEDFMYARSQQRLKDLSIPSKTRSITLTVTGSIFTIYIIPLGLQYCNPVYNFNQLNCLLVFINISCKATCLEQR